MFWVPPDARWSHIQSQAKQPGIGQTLDKAMDIIESETGASKAFLPKVFSRMNVASETLGELIDLVRQYRAGQGKRTVKRYSRQGL